MLPQNIFILILLATSIATIFIFMNQKNKSRELYDNLIPNKIRWNIYSSKTKNEIKKNYINCVNTCNKSNSNYGCQRACNDLVFDKLRNARNGNRIYSPTY